jgi:hypothetical protein
MGVARIKVLPENVDMDKISWYDMLSEEVAWMES